jgi:hypothetical protein
MNHGKDKEMKKSSTKKSINPESSYRRRSAWNVCRYIRDNGKLYYCINPTCPPDEWERKQRLLLSYSFSQNI